MKRRSRVCSTEVRIRRIFNCHAGTRRPGDANRGCRSRAAPSCFAPHWWPCTLAGHYAEMVFFLNPKPKRPAPGLRSPTRDPVGGIDQAQHHLAALEHVVDQHRGGDEAAPEDQARQRAADKSPTPSVASSRLSNAAITMLADKRHHHGREGIFGAWHRRSISRRMPRLPGLAQQRVPDRAEDQAASAAAKIAR